MAYLVARPAHRPDGGGTARYEIRESVTTAAGPRARTLATFRVLTPAVLAGAAGRAVRPFDPEKIRTRATELGVAQRSPRAVASEAATALIASLRNGDTLPPAFVAELRRVLPRAKSISPDSLESASDWIGVDDDARGRALRDLLDVADRIPARARPPKSSFPRLSSNSS